MNKEFNSSVEAVSKAEFAYDELAKRKAAANLNIAEIAKARKKLSFLALSAGDEVAQKELDKLNQATVVASLEAENLQHALEEANALLKEATARHDKVKAKLTAAETLDNQLKLEAAARELDKTLKEFVKLYPKFAALAINVLSASGRERGSSASAVRVFGQRALYSALLPIEGALGLGLTIPPRNRTTWEKAVADWAPNVTASCRSVLEEEQ